MNPTKRTLPNGKTVYFYDYCQVRDSTLQKQADQTVTKKTQSSPVWAYHSTGDNRSKPRIYGD